MVVASPVKTMRRLACFATHCSKEVLYHVTGGGIVWRGKGRKFLSGTDVIEVTEVTGIGLCSLEDSLRLHIVHG